MKPEIKFSDRLVQELSQEQKQELQIKIIKALRNKFGTTLILPDQNLKATMYNSEVFKLRTNKVSEQLIYEVFELANTPKDNFNQIISKRINSLTNFKRFIDELKENNISISCRVSCDEGVEKKDNKLEFRFNSISIYSSYTFCGQVFPTTVLVPNFYAIYHIISQTYRNVLKLPNINIHLSASNLRTVLKHNNEYYGCHPNKDIFYNLLTGYVVNKADVGLFDSLKSKRKLAMEV